jgi:hypothetical protein
MDHGEDFISDSHRKTLMAKVMDRFFNGPDLLKDSILCKDILLLPLLEAFQQVIKDNDL